MVPVDSGLTATPGRPARSGGLAILVVTADRERWHAALAIAQANAALGRTTALYLHESAVALLSVQDGAAADAIAMGVRIIACQSGLAALGIGLDSLPFDIEAGGLVSFLAETGEERMIAL